MLKLAPTSYGTTPDETTVVVDVYEAAPSTPTNQFKKIINVKGKDISDKLSKSGKFKKFADPSLFAKGGKLDKIAKGLTKAYSQKGKLDKKAIADALGTATGLPIGKIVDNPRQFTAHVANSLGLGNTVIGKNLDAFAKGVGIPDYTALFLDKDKNIFTVYKELETKVKNFDGFDSLGDLSKVINDLTGDPDLFGMFNLTDTVNKIRIANNLMNEYNMPSMVDKFMENIKSEKQRDMVYVELLTDIQVTKDLVFLNSAIDKVGTGTVLNKSPNIVKSILENYNELKNPNSFTELTNTLGRIDPDWYKATPTIDKAGFDLSRFRNLSPTVKNTFMQSDEFVVPTMIAELYPDQDFRTSLAQTFPWAVIK